MGSKKLFIVNSTRLVLPLMLISVVVFISCGGSTSHRPTTPEATTTTSSPASATPAAAAPAPPVYAQATSGATASAPAATSAADELDRAIVEASDYLNEKIPQGDKVAFVSARKTFPALSEYIIEGLTENAVNDKVFTVVDRSQLDAIRSELEFQMSGDVSDSTVRSIGRILGVKTIVTVVVSQVGSMYRFGVRALEVESAEIRGLINRNIPSGPTIDALARTTASPSTPVGTATAGTSAPTRTPTTAPPQTAPSASEQAAATTPDTTLQQQSTQPVYGKFTDSRDNKAYRTVRIGNYTWMAENLNYQTSNSWCYNNNSSYCAKYGRLYTWNVATTACPSGWRLPTLTDWDILMAAIGGVYKETYYWDYAGRKLKSTSGWNNQSDGSSGNGTDEFGFRALPGGLYYGGDNFQFIGTHGYWWSATRREHLTYKYLYALRMDYNNDVVHPIEGMGYWASVRCVKN